MGLFLGKKKEVKKTGDDLSDLPTLDDSDMPQFPVYEPSFKDIKSEVSGSKPVLEDDFSDAVPVRKSGKIVRKDPEFNEVSFSEKSSGKPLFVKIEKYKSALTSMDVLRKKISDAEKVLKDIDKVRSEEEKALEQWRNDLDAVKSKLLELDEDLFEV